MTPPGNLDPGTQGNQGDDKGDTGDAGKDKGSGDGGTGGNDGGDAGGGNGDGGSAASWRDTLPDELKNEGAIQSFSDVTALTKSYVHAVKNLHADKISLPGKHATAEDWRAVHHKLGLPEKVEDYTIEKGKHEIDEEFFTEFKAKAHEHGILPAQAQKVFDWFQEKSAGAMQGVLDADEAEVTADTAALKKEWGDGYDKQLFMAKAAVTHFGDDDLVKYLNETGLTNNIHLTKLMAKVGATLSEDKIAGQGAGIPGKTPAQAKQEVDEIMGDMKGPYWVKEHPRHKEMVETVTSLKKAMAAGQNQG